MKTLTAHRILVTGASGFTGGWLTEHLLDAGAAVTTLLHDVDPQSRFVTRGLERRVAKVYGSILDYEGLVRIIAGRGIDTVFHLAAMSIRETAHARPRESFELNVRGTCNVLDACRVNADRVRRVIVASSDKVYGDHDLLPYTEEVAVQGMNPYDASKSCADLIARSYFHSYGLPVSVGRFGNVYGGGDLNGSRLIPNTIGRLMRGEAPRIRVPARGVFKRDFLYVKDLIGAYMAMFEGLARPEVGAQAFNFGTGAPYTVMEVVERIQRIMGLQRIEPLVEPSGGGEILQQQLSFDRARRVLGWTPRYSLDDGLAETVAWYRDAV